MVDQIRLDGKKILVGVTGSIAAYKACELVRLYFKAGADVRVVMTEAAARFVSPLTFEALSASAVLTEGGESWHDDHNHIGLGDWADLFVIAPATANTINKMASGIADNLLLQTALAFPKTILLAPAANTRMIEHPTTVANLKRLALHRIETVEPQTKLLACNTVGKGAMAEPETIFAASLKHLFEKEYWKNRRVVVTGGGTIEKIDEVRYLSNFSSGKMARALALALYSRGADVCYITSTGSEGLPDDLYVIDIESSEELLNYTVDAIRVAKKGKMSKATMNSSDPVHLIQKRPFLFMAAAVSDFTPKYPQKGKLKKSQLGAEWSLELKETEDILTALNKDGIYTIAFKAEMDSEKGLTHARELLEKKEVDAVCYNLLRDSESFGTDDNEITLICKERELSLGRSNKLSLAFNILNRLKDLEK